MSPVAKDNFPIHEKSWQVLNLSADQTKHIFSRRRTPTASESSAVAAARATVAAMAAGFFVIAFSLLRFAPQLLSSILRPCRFAFSFLLFAGGSIISGSSRKTILRNELTVGQISWQWWIESNRVSLTNQDLQTGPGSSCAESRILLLGWFLRSKIAKKRKENKNKRK